MYRLIKTDNPTTKGNSELNKAHNFTFDGYNFYFGSVRSSRVKSIIIDNNKMEVATKNTTYVFKRERTSNV